MQSGRSVPVKKVELSRLGRRIRRARELLGLSQDGFAFKCGLDRSYLGGVERGDRNLTFGVLCTICEGLSFRHALLLFQESLDLESLLEPWNRSAGKPIIDPLSADAKLSG